MDMEDSGHPQNKAKICHNLRFTVGGVYKGEPREFPKYCKIL